MSRFLVIALAGDNPQLHERARRVAVDAIRERLDGTGVSIDVSVVLPDELELQRRVAEQHELLEAYVAVGERWEP